MNVTVPEAAKPRHLALTWLDAQGVYILAADSVKRSFVDPCDAAAATRAAMDPRLYDMPEWNC